MLTPTGRRPSYRCPLFSSPSLLFRLPRRVLGMAPWAKSFAGTFVLQEWKAAIGARGPDTRAIDCDTFPRSAPSGLDADSYFTCRDLFTIKQPGNGRWQCLCDRSRG